MDTVKLTDYHLNERNPRYIKDDRFEDLKRSLAHLPKMMELRPIIVDGDGMILGGNMRYRALLALGYDEVPASWVVCADDLTPDEASRFVVADNSGYGEWDFDILSSDYEIEELEEFGLDLEELGLADIVPGEDGPGGSEPQQNQQPKAKSVQCPECGTTFIA